MSQPIKVWDCGRCGHEVERYRGQSDVECPNCGASYNAFGQRLTDNWRDNPSYRYGDCGDMEGYESMSLQAEEFETFGPMGEIG